MRTLAVGIRHVAQEGPRVPMKKRDFTAMIAGLGIPEAVPHKGQSPAAFYAQLMLAGGKK